MLLAAHQDHHPLAHVGVGQVPAHAELPRHRLEPLPEAVQVEGERLGDDLDAEEEPAGGQVAVLGRLEHRAAVAGDEAADRGHDPDAIGAGDGQDEASHPPIIPERRRAGREPPGRP